MTLSTEAILDVLAASPTPMTTRQVADAVGGVYRVGFGYPDHGDLGMRLLRLYRRGLIAGELDAKGHRSWLSLTPAPAPQPVEAAEVVEVVEVEFVGPVRWLHAPGRAPSHAYTNHVRAVCESVPFTDRLRPERLGTRRCPRCEVATK